MQELIDWLEDLKERYPISAVQVVINRVIEKAAQLLENERLQIEVAHANGIHDASIHIDGEKLKTPKQYFDETYKK